MRRHGNTQTLQREEDHGSGALNRVSQSGIRRGRRILRGDCNSPMGQVGLIQVWIEYYSSGSGSSTVAVGGVLYIRTPDIVTVWYHNEGTAHFRAL
jgi:hypothetical protein